MNEVKEPRTSTAASATPAAEHSWHAQSGAAALQALDSRDHGLTAEEAAARLARHGRNEMARQAGRGPVRRFLTQFNNLLIHVLLGAAAITAGLGHWLDSGVILGVVLINAIIGFVQEGKAEAAMQAIARMLSPQATVRRDGRLMQIPAADLVPGDIVVIGSGDKVPADLRLLSTASLQVQEAVLTGESLAVDKSPRAVAAEAPLGDRSGMAFSGTLVTAGRGVGVVVATGMHTEIGRISEMLAHVQPLTTPLLRQMAVFGRWLTFVILTVAALTFALGTLLRGYAPSEMFLAAVGLAVAAIPEGLPAIMTIALAIGVAGMARQNAIVRRLPAVETLGSVTTICSDKTGTLTRNELTVRRIVTPAASCEVSGAGYAPEGRFTRAGEALAPGGDPAIRHAIRAGLRCNDAELRRGAEGDWEVLGSPMDGALLALAGKAGLPLTGDPAAPRLDSVPFESAHKYMATLHDDAEAGVRPIYLKGAPERVLAYCGQGDHGGDDWAAEHQRWEREVEDLAAAGYRTIAIAERDVPASKDSLSHGDIHAGGFRLLGLFALIDPSREEAVAAVADCRRAGIRVKMITGDHAATARAVARQLGIGGEAGGRALTGPELDALSDDDLAREVQRVDVYARTSPEHKLRLVQALQAQHQIVAMTGDGVNDAPALKRADVGIAMGRRGTEAAKEAAEMVLADDNFATIAMAVHAGRTVYDNLKKAILFILPTNAGQAMTILAGIALGTLLPITPLQILWVNMVTAVTLALALVFEPAEPGVMSRPPRRPEEPLLSGFMVWRVFMVGVLLVLATFGLFWLARSEGAGIAQARTIAVNALVAAEIVYLFNSRMMYAAAWSGHALRSCGPALVSVGLVVLLQLAFTYVPVMQLLFDTAPLSGSDWLRIAGAAVLVFLCVEAEKALMSRPLRRSRRAAVAE